MRIGSLEEGKKFPVFDNYVLHVLFAESVRELKKFKAIKELAKE